MIQKNLLLDTSFLTEEELQTLPFMKIGKRVRISRAANIVGIEKISIGDDSRIDPLSCLIAANDGGIEIGNNIHIGSHAYLSASSAKIIIEDFSGLSQGTRIYTGSDDFSGEYLTNPTIPRQFVNITKGDVVLGRHTIIGSGTVILPGCIIGEGAAIGAQSLVTTSLPPWNIYFGSPVRLVKKRSRNLLLIEKAFLEYKRDSII